MGSSNSTPGESGSWFQDARKNTNLPRPLMGWPTPEGLKDELKRDVEVATKKLKEESAVIRLAVVDRLLHFALDVRRPRPR